MNYFEYFSLKIFHLPVLWSSFCHRLRFIFAMNLWSCDYFRTCIFMLV